MSNGRKVIVVGGGPGGLTAAMVLAYRGYEVELFEKEAQVGGRNGVIDLQGFRFDIGPTFLMMKFVLDQAFSEAGARSEDLLEFQKLDPMYRLIFPEFSFDITQNREQMKRAIAQHFPQQEQGLDAFFAKEGKRFEHIYSCLEKEYSSLLDFLRPSFLRALPWIPLGRSLFEYLGSYFAPERLRLSFTFQSKYLGMSPWECPAFFVILPYIEHEFGIFHVRGGLSEISRAMADLAVRNGARIHLSTPVRQLLVEDGHARGVVLADGRTVQSDAVVLNADFAHAMQTLVPQGVLKKYAPENLARKKYSCSTFMLYLGLSRSFPELPHHTIVFASDYHKNTQEIFTQLRLSEDFSFYIRNASLHDDSLAPEGKSALYILVPTPNQASGIDWKSEAAAFRERVLDAIAERTELGDLRPYIEVEKIITPADWQDSGVYLGATFNLAHSIDQMLCFRPHNHFEEMDGCYLVGGGTHPGSGLPTIYQSGLIAARLIAQHFPL